MQKQKHAYRCRDDQNLQVGHRNAAQRKHRLFQQIRKAFAACAQKRQIAVFQKEAAHQRRNDNVEPVRALLTQGPVGDPLQRDAHQGCQYHGCRNGQRHNHRARKSAGINDAVAAQQKCGHKKGDVGAHHEDVAMREVDKQQHAVHQRVPQRNQCVKASPLQCVKNVLKKDLHRSSLEKRLPGCGSAARRPLEFYYSVGQTCSVNTNLPSSLMRTTTAHLIGSP